ncbi:biotin/lipoyl-containing protein [Shimia sp.]|uniref:acetyl-CoA carboxylase biotin carboxyl carrier protein n=1 Tax=Shimia sp. TaxID=1954381 RepID=UPI003299F88F
MSDKLTHSDIEDIMALVEGSSFDQLSLEMGDLKLSLRRSGAGAPVQGSPRPTVATPVPTAPMVTSEQSATAPAASPAQGLTDVPSQMLGTFYHASKPGADPFVSVGTVISPDTVIGIIEVMKLMTSVEAGVSGIVAEITAPDGELVEHGQVLIRVRQD